MRPACHLDTHNTVYWGEWKSGGPIIGSSRIYREPVEKANLVYIPPTFCRRQCQQLWSVIRVSLWHSMTYPKLLILSGLTVYSLSCMIWESRVNAGVYFIALTRIFIVRSKYQIELQDGTRCTVGSIRVDFFR